jgi:hypothetical protein
MYREDVAKSRVFVNILWLQTETSKFHNITMARAVKVSDELVSEAAAEARVMERSTAGQIEHWARIGRAIERSPNFSHRRVKECLSGRRAFQALQEEEQAVVTAETRRALSNLPPDPEFAKELRKSGVASHGTDPRFPGKIIEVRPDGTRYAGTFQEGRFVAEMQISDPPSRTRRAPRSTR